MSETASRAPIEMPQPRRGLGSRGAFAVVVLVASWYWMQIIHELGHVLAGVGTGGSVGAVVLEFLSFSRTDVEPNPRPLVVVWSGPIVGVLVPLAAWATARWKWSLGAGILGFIAGFCLIANGAYIGIGSIDGIGDAGDMLRLGSQAWILWAFGAASSVGGLAVWHSVGRAPPSMRQAHWTVAITLLIAALLIVSIV